MERNQLIEGLINHASKARLEHKEYKGDHDSV